MKDKTISSKETKLKTLRKILTLSFAAVSLPIVLFTIISTFAYIKSTNSISIIEGLIILGVLVVLTGLAALVLFVIYYFFKTRIDKEDELFL